MIWLLIKLYYILLKLYQNFNQILIKWLLIKKLLNKDYSEFGDCAGTQSHKNFYLTRDQRTVIKKLSNNEDEIYESLQVLPKFHPFLAKYYGVGLVENNPYIKLENLLYDFTDGNIIDIKARAFYKPLFAIYSIWFII